MIRRMLELKEPLESLIRSPRTLTAGTRFPRSGEIRDGEQTPGTGIHTAGITIHPSIYQVIEPESVGGHMRFLFGKHSGPWPTRPCCGATERSCTRRVSR
jgi:hypothetical protein